METFALSAYTDATGTPDFMYNETVTLNKDEGRWYPTGTYYWPGKKQLSFYAWFPSAADGMTLTGNTDVGAPVITYTVPDLCYNTLDNGEVLEKRCIHAESNPAGHGRQIGRAHV